MQLTQVPVSHHMFGTRANAGAQVDHKVIEPFYREGYVILEHVAVTAESLCDPLPQGPQHLGQRKKTVRAHVNGAPGASISDMALL